MTENQEFLKLFIETDAKKQFDVDVCVEYVADVSDRVKELERIIGEKFNPVYEADTFTGQFIPAVNNNPYYILIQENRRDMLDVMTAFHEYRHLIDFIYFFRTVFDGDIDKLKGSPLYVTFNVYSEYSAMVYGIQKYIEIMGREGISKDELGGLILQNARSQYENMLGIENRYQLLIHSIKYLGNIVACSSYVDTQGLVSEMYCSEELYPIMNHMSIYINKYEWYIEMDKIMRDFVDGGY